MKKLLSIIYISLVSIVSLYAQQVPLYSQYFNNDYIINPAIAGTVKDYTPLRLSVHKQWVGIEESPSTQVLSIHHQLSNEVMGVGGLIFHDSFGPTRQFGINLTYSYLLNINDDIKLSMGLSAVMMQYVIKLSQDDFYTYEPILNRERTSITVPDAHLGFYAYDKDWWAGLSIMHLLQSRLKITTTWMDNENKMVRHYFLMGGYKFSFPTAYLLEIEPSALVKFTEVTPMQIDFNVRLIYNKDFWTGISVRPGDSFVFLIGFTFKEYHFGMSYDFTFSDLSNHTIGSQELVFGWNIGDSRIGTQRYF
ncbi:MAG TPA: type IX secretion system membrane protein PorP/SprF [Bacteroidales bacterium]|jgi:type IX secretion system PorP/SprF family membrane protein|nr:type IX secretion system membrane protein PorP/SprF [Bacteroidales bacterium]MDD4235433.1 type IX secretion system membrane protein PorP/SprF [Bacteroidales bacterium]MDY0159737.1 type IX secretion system membrane protein PorP/SprF [Bacteroidales bacterium]HXK80768.1 type IX secretion system membrane protein PorP/SprF [Bacteroidales bacterium]